MRFDMLLRNQGTRFDKLSINGIFSAVPIFDPFVLSSSKDSEAFNTLLTIDPAISN